MWKFLGQAVWQVIKKMGSKKAKQNVSSKIVEKKVKGEIKSKAKPSQIKPRKGHAEEKKTGKISKEREERREEYRKEHEEYSKKMEQLVDKELKNDWSKDITNRAANEETNKAQGLSKGEIKDASTRKEISESIKETPEDPDKINSIVKPIIGTDIIRKLTADDAEAKENDQNSLEEKTTPNNLDEMDERSSLEEDKEKFFAAMDEINSDTQANPEIETPEMDQEGRNEFFTALSNLEDSLEDETLTDEQDMDFDEEGKERFQLAMNDIEESEPDDVGSFYWTGESYEGHGEMDMDGGDDGGDGD